MLFGISAISVVMSPFPFLILLIWILSLLGEPGQRFASLVSFQRTSSWFCSFFFYCFLNLLFPLCPLSSSFLITNATDAVNLILNITQRIVYF